LVCCSIAPYSFLIIAVATILAQALIVRLKFNRARALAITGSLIGAAAYGVALLDHGVADTVLASVLLGVSPSSHRRSPRSPRFRPPRREPRWARCPRPRRSASWSARRWHRISIRSSIPCR